MAVQSSGKAGPGAAGEEPPAGRLLSVPGSQDSRAVKSLRLGVGIIGVSLPIMLIMWNLIAGDKTIFPTSMSGSYYTSARNLFVGSLCALGVFLILYRHTTLQNLCTWCMGAFALLVAFAPTAPAPPATEPQWVNYLHHAAAGALILTLGAFCFVLELGDAAGAASLDPAEPTRYSEQLKVPRWRRIVYFVCGGLVLLSGTFALYTGVWPTSWSTGWSSLYLFEAVAVFAFGIAWITAAAVRAITIQQRVVADLVRQRGNEDPATRTAWARLAASYGSAGHTLEAMTALDRITDSSPPPTPDLKGIGRWHQGQGRASTVARQRPEPPQLRDP
jgi:hypothetical protein